MGVLGDAKELAGDTFDKAKSAGSALKDAESQLGTATTPDGEQVEIDAEAPIFAHALTGVGGGATMIGSLGKLATSGGKLGSIGGKTKTFLGSTKGKLTLGGLGLGGAGELTDSVPSFNPFSGDGMGTGSENTFDLDDWGFEDYGSDSGTNAGSGGIPFIPGGSGSGSSIGTVAILGAAALAAVVLLGGDR